MAVGTRSSGSSNFAGITDTPTLTSVAAQIDDWIYAFWAWRGTGGGGGTNVVLSGAPTWNGQTMAQIGSTIPMVAADTGTLQLAVYRVKASANATANIVATFAAAQYANCVAGYSVKTGVDGTTPNDTPQTQQIFASYSAPSVTVGSMASGDEILELLGEFGWDSGYSDTSAATWSPTNSQSNVFNQASSTDTAGFPQLRLDTKTGTGSIGVGYTASGGLQPGYIHWAARLIAASAAAVISSGTPSGTLGTQTTATLGATTNQTTGTLYGVVTTASLTGVTAAQVKAGQNASGSTSGVSSGNSAVSTTTPSIGITGLTAGTTYNYAEVQNNTNGDSNVIIGSFTTASASLTTSLTIVDAAGANVASTSLTWWLRQGNVIVANGTTSTNGSGLLSLSVPTAAAGAATLYYQNAGNTLSGERVVTVA